MTLSLFLQLWGLVIGIGNETYRKHWQYYGPGVSFWRVRCATRRWRAH